MRAILTDEQAKHFYELWIPLLDFVNRKYRLEKALYGMTSSRGLPTDSIAKITDKLWKDVTVIDEYLESDSCKLPEPDRQIVRSWKKAKRGDYIVDRHLARGSVLISLADRKVYVVKGIYSDWREMLNYGPVPQIVGATLIPYEDCLINDSLVRPYHILLSRNIAEQSKQAYLNAKRNGELISSIE